MLFYKLIISALSLVGLCSLLKLLITWIYRRKQEMLLCEFLPLSGDCYDIEYLIRSALYDLRTAHGNSGRFLIIVDCGIGDETMKICRIMQRNDNSIKIYTPLRLAELFANNEWMYYTENK